MLEIDIYVKAHVCVVKSEYVFARLVPARHRRRSPHRGCRGNNFAAPSGHCPFKVLDLFSDFVIDPSLDESMRQVTIRGI